MSTRITDPFQAIADPNRRQILFLLSKDRLTINAVSAHFDMSRPAVSKHIRILSSAGFITIREVGRERYCNLDRAGFLALQEWIRYFDGFWRGKLDALDKFLSASLPVETAPLAKSKASQGKPGVAPVKSKPAPRTPKASPGKSKPAPRTPKASPGKSKSAHRIPKASPGKSKPSHGISKASSGKQKSAPQTPKASAKTRTAPSENRRMGTARSIRKKRSDHSQQ